MRKGGNILRVLFVSLAAASFFPIATSKADQPQPQPTQRPPRIAVVNPYRIFAELPEKKDMDAANQVEYKKNQVDIAAQGDKIKRLIDDLQNIRPDHPQYAEQIAKIDRAKLELDMAKKGAEIALERRQVSQLIKIFGELQTAVATVAQQQQIDLVITENRRDLSPAEMNNLSVNTLSQYYGSQNVLFSSKNVDITDLVIARMEQMNADAKKAAQNAGGAAQAAGGQPRP